MAMGAPVGSEHTEENEEGCNSVEYKTGNRRLASPITDFTITEKLKWLFVKFCEYKNQIYTPT